MAISVSPYSNALRRLIKHAGYTFREVAEETKIPERTLYDWAAGKHVISRQDRIVLARVLGCTVQELAPASSSQVQLPESIVLEKEDEMNKKRRELLRLLSVAGSILILPGIDRERLSRVISTPSLLEEPVLRDLEAINRHYWSIYRFSSSKSTVLDGVLGQLKTVTGLLGDARGVSLQSGLGVLASDLAQLAGEVFFDTNDYATAQSCYTFAAAAAKEAAHYDLWASALVRNAFLPIYDQQYQDAIPLLRQAERIAVRGDTSLVTRYWVAAVAAEAHAGDENLIACQKALDLAEEVRHVHGGANGGWLRFDVARLPEQRGTCFVRLKQPDLAFPALQEALTQQQVPTRRRGMILNDCAQAALLQQNVEQACTYAHEVIEIASQGSSGVLKKGLYMLRVQLGPFELTDAVRQFDQHLSVLQ